MSLEDKTLQPVENTTQEKIMDLNLDAIKKTKVRINGENDKVLELNLSDLGITQRLQVVYDELQDLAHSAEAIQLDDTDSESIKAASAKLMELDEQMRDKVDWLFDAPVSAICAANGTMFDPMAGGKFRFEYIIEKLSDLYAGTFKKEFAAMERNVSKRTAKYVTPQDHLTSTKKRSKKN